ncbi:NADH-cytochrome b5 reductase [Trichophyton mentagrophytes]|uniref:NADH-cytochrome b5 reductase n=3 Tax=Trichophyton TaxID=5550 RepID=A0A059JDC7_TRIIM|nr:NADH-cytochrome b5 reductase [Trichophyton tonsurans CBS 112818]EGE06820.1 NADH-cytochrome b5 reductase [Trichophyton equinum CBS 127.97]EZF34868.1 NADH-cytochrome b5 reductase 2 [Trichophyton interdigitale H6]KDB25896.1 NADH-cytochrome b5 reductase 2 [Trichophyton interdigitale MR816]GBF62379.1 NADH-cytochrome b5 reductase [Trichophyton mentagrophytes]
MFARFSRTAGPLRQGIRKYSTEAPKSSSQAPLFAGLAVVAGAGYYYWQMQQMPGAAIKKDRKPVFTGGDQGWVDLKLSAVEEVSHNVKKLRFELPDSESVSGLHIASALLTKFKGEGDAKATIRPYTPVSDEDEPGHLDLLVKKYPGGPMSTHIHELSVGEPLSFKGPIPKYEWEANKHSHVCMVAGGTGITPMYQLIRKIFSNPADKTQVTLIYGNVGEEDILLRRELEHLENMHPRQFKVLYLLDRPGEGWTGGKGYVTKELVQMAFPEPKTEGIKLFVCGPPGMYKAVSGPKVSPKDQGELTGILKELGYTKEQVYKF